MPRFHPSVREYVLVGEVIAKWELEKKKGADRKACSRFVARTSVAVLDKGICAGFFAWEGPNK